MPFMVVVTIMSHDVSTRVLVRSFHYFLVLWCSMESSSGREPDLTSREVPPSSSRTVFVLSIEAGKMMRRTIYLQYLDPSPL